MRFNEGEKVKFLYEVGEGIVIKYINKNTVLVKDETGFEKEFILDKLVKIHGDLNGVSGVVFKDWNEVKVTKRYGRESLRNVMKKKSFWEIDLHSHVILDTERGLTSGQIFERQMDEFKRCFYKVKENKIRKLIVIHGVGEGVLKSGIRYFLEGKPDLEFYDADFRDYGKGATEVCLFYH